MRWYVVRMNTYHNHEIKNSKGGKNLSGNIGIKSTSENVWARSLPITKYKYKQHFGLNQLKMHYMFLSDELQQKIAFWHFDCNLKKS